VEKPDRPAGPLCPLAYTRSETFAATREYFRGGSRLKHTGDLARWNIEELPSGHCLISALNPAAWFEAGVPNDETLAAARRDFGKALMDKELIEKHAYLDLT
jgi:hypothetical protein